MLQPEAQQIPPLLLRSLVVMGTCWVHVILVNQVACASRDMKRRVQVCLCELRRNAKQGKARFTGIEGIRACRFHGEFSLGARH